MMLKGKLEILNSICRKLLNLKTVGALVASLVFFMAVGYAEEERTDAGGQWRYVLEDGGAVVTGCVAEPSGHLVIPRELDGHPVTGIGDNALDGGHSLISVAIPDSVTSIGFWTFLECRSLISIDVSSDNAVYAQIDGVLFDKSQKTLLSYPAARKGAYAVPDGVTHIETNAFGGCDGLTDVTIPGSVTSMGDYAFQNCENLTSVTIEKGLTHISFGAFSNCGSLQAVAIPDSVTSIDVTAFVHCGSLDNVTIPDSVTSIGDEAFFGCSGMTNVTIPDSITRIGDRVFYKCSGMTGVTIPESVTSIGEEAFFGCDSLRSVTVPASVTGIGEDAFAYCEELTLIVRSGSIAEQYAQENRISYTYTGSSGIPVGITVSKRTDASRQWRYVLEDGATVTGFVEDPVGDLAIPDELDGYPVTGIGDNAFGECWDVTSVTIPAGVARIGDWAFSGCMYLKSVTIPEGVTSIGSYAFADCRGLPNVTIPASVTSMGTNPFAVAPFEGSALEHIDVAPGNPRYEAIDGVLFDKREKMLVSFPGARGGAYTIPEGVLVIGRQAFGVCWELTDVTIPDSVTNIDDWAFAYCDELTDVIIPNGVTRIGEGAFYACSGLLAVTVPESVTEIGEQVFDGCDTLALVVTEGGFAERYAKENDIPYMFAGSNAPIVVVEDDDEIRTGADRQWTYVLAGGAKITGCVKEPSGDLVIPSKLDGYAVTGISEEAMYGYGNLTSVTIPASVTSMGTNPFAVAPFEGSALEHIDVAPGNPRYEDIDGVLFDKQEKMLVSFPGGREGAYTIPEGVLVIGSHAFAVCWELTDVTIPDSVTNIDDWAFAYCDALTNVTIPDGVMRIGEGAFDGCGNLIILTIPPSVTAISEGAFSRCEQLNLCVQAGSNTERYAKENGIPYVFVGSDTPIVVEDDDEGRTDASGQWVYSLKDGGATIWRYAGEPAGALTIPNMLDGYPVTAIGDEAFWECAITRCSIPDSVTSISDDAFLWCDSLSRIDVSSDNPAYAQIDGVLFDKAKQTLITYPPAKEGAYAVPEGVLHIASNAFAGCVGLTEVTIPDCVTSMGDHAFGNCENLAGVTIGGGVTRISTDAFYECGNLSAVTIPDSVTSIGDYAFYGCGSLTSVAIPSGVTSIGECAFLECYALTDANIQEGVTNIGKKAFWQCTGLTGVAIPGSVTSIGYGAFAECENLSSVTIAEGVPAIGEYAFYKCHGLTSLDIPNSVTSIGSGAFYECSGLTSLVIPEGVTELADRLLAECSGLVSVTLPEGSTSIGEYAFYYCNGLTNVTIPASVTSIGEDAFAGCEALTLNVARDSAGEQYAKDNRMPYVFIGNTDAGKAEADEAVLERGVELMEARDFDGALAHFDAAIAENVGVAEYHAKRGEALLFLERGAEAERAYAKAVQIEPDNARNWDEYGGILMFLSGKYQDAYETIGKAVALEPSNGEYVSDRGIALFYMDRHDEALAELERGIQLTPDYPRAYDFAAYLQIKRGEFDEAILLCEKGLAVMPDYDALLLTLGDAKYGLGNYTGAVEAYERAFSIGYFSADDAENYGPAKRAVAAEKAAESFTGDLEEITVSNTEELLSALGSNRRILLEEGVYNLTIAEPGFSGNANVYLEECFEGSELVLNGVHNLTIQGTGDGRSEIVVEPRDASVVRFLNCTNIRIEGITAGHTEGGACGGGVFAFDYCADITIEGTQMYGCGTIGLDLYWSAGIEAIGSTIYECTSGAMYIEGCSNVSFQDCVFKENTGDIMVYVEATSNVTIDSCSFLRNAGEQAMFSISESENVVVKNTEFIGNDVRELIYPDHKDTEFDASNRFENNAFD